MPDRRSSGAAGAVTAHRIKTAEPGTRNLVNHLANEVVGLFDRPLFAFRGPQSALGLDTFRDGAFRTADPLAATL
ncbi:hypothetical protein [Streptomyces sp. NRRL WC-3742]|uniref:hypothetical protein n=1 Tax=Streptomyces sp. NRRL WC-3742 TaxID=1463934 RepID=UPI0004C87FA2|nr:hypothetical protein [Streptomyces sp. NRRL WC-3742]